ncbi:hypothetical protein LguiA_002467 [Lonicera macranthoides]
MFLLTPSSLRLGLLGSNPVGMAVWLVGHICASLRVVVDRKGVTLYHGAIDLATLVGALFRCLSFPTYGACCSGYLFDLLVYVLFVLVDFIDLRCAHHELSEKPLVLREEAIALHPNTIHINQPFHKIRHKTPAIKGSSQCVLKYGAPEALDVTRKFINEPVGTLMKHHGFTLLLH